MAYPFDVIIVGAGPAGATAAYFLGEAGMKVMVIEKETLPRYKTCGGGISMNMLDHFPFSFDPVIESRVSSVFYDYRGERVNIPIANGEIGMVMRDRFDAHILSHVKAEICSPERVTQIRELSDGVEVQFESGKTTQACYLIGADGANSIVARSLGLRKQRTMVAAIEIEADVPSDVLRYYANRPVFSFGELKRGYMWVFPKRDHLSVGAGAYRPAPGELQSGLRRVMARLGIRVDRTPMRGHPIPIYTRPEKIANTRSILIGDAAGLVDPFTGEGIRLAITSGRLAAESILREDIGQYERAVHRQIASSHLLGLNLARLFYLIPEICFALGVRNPKASEAFLKMLAGRASYPQVIFSLFATLPVHLIREVTSLISQPGRNETEDPFPYPTNSITPE